jgi:hypothetical protein
MSKTKHNRGINHKAAIEGSILKAVTGVGNPYVGETKRQRRSREAEQKKSPKECYGY